ncbi:hypothetical protein, partial [Chryseobacterium indologenes]|uniref:hypothetical protein n=1 Tax=Chryseobacterium indologenes TaxID=253 RepID=UPI0022E31C67
QPCVLFALQLRFNALCMSTEHYSSYNKLTICLLREAFLDKDLSFDFLKNPPTYQRVNCT